MRAAGVDVTYREFDYGWGPGGQGLRGSNGSFLTKVYREPAGRPRSSQAPPPPQTH
jgi:hypothetical protein